VTLRGEPVKIRSDGTFAVRFNLPIAGMSSDGGQQPRRRGNNARSSWLSIATRRSWSPSATIRSSDDVYGQAGH